MSRILTIASREFAAYVKTVGFWVSLLALPLIAALGIGFGYFMSKNEPVRNVAVVETSAGAGLSDGMAQAIAVSRDREAARTMAAVARMEGGEAGADKVRHVAETQGYEAGMAELKKVAPASASSFTRPRDTLVILPTPASVASAADPAAREAAIRAQLGEETEDQDNKLNAIVILDRVDGAPAATVWTRRASDNDTEFAIRSALTEVGRQESLRAAGVDPALVESIQKFRPEVKTFSPDSASGGEVEFRDRLPLIIGLGLGFTLWSLILTGASILMNSVMEEKANKVLEVLLSSASATEILAGKVLGVAMLTATVLLVWGGLGIGLLGMTQPAMVQDILTVMMRDGVLGYLLIYLVGGYLMYAVVFAAIGAFCETPRDAQTLMGPIMMILMVPLFVMQMGIRNPESEVVQILSFVPLFTPFLMTARTPVGVPMLEHLIAIGSMVALVVVMIWISGRAFRAGALSDVKLSWKSFGAAIKGGGR